MQTVIERFSTTGGFLQSAEVRLSKGLNCIIGARGTCKSTLVESIRFAFDHDQERIRVLVGKDADANFPGLGGMLPATLRGGAVRCEVRDGIEDVTYSIERDVDSAPRIYREGVKDHTDTSLLDYVEIYSQGDLQRIAEHEHLRLRLIDRPNQSRIDTLRAQQDEVAEKMRRVGPRIRAVRAQAEQLRTSVRSLPELQNQLDQLRANRPALSSELAAERVLFLQRQAASQAIEQAIESRNAAVSAIEDLTPHVGDMKAQLQAIHDEALQETTEIEDALRDAIETAEQAMAAAQALSDIPLAGRRDALVAVFENLNEPYFQMRQQEEDANRTLKEEDHLRLQVEHFEKQRLQLEQYESELQTLVLERTTLRLRMRALADEVFHIRNTEVDAVNQKHGSIVVLTLEPGAISEAYIAEVQRLLQGSRLRAQEEIGRELAMSLSPPQLIDIVEAGQTAELASVLGRDIAQATRLMSFLLDNEELYSLEGYIFEDRLNIILFDDGQPKPVHTLSKGQKATALLPLILREAEYPLIFDQPEDDLDNRFIFSSLIQTILELKTKRQLIFVTHNANIPVIGEAETVVVMGMDAPDRASVPLHGDVDERQKEIVDLLEGGAEAFQARRRRYKGMLGADQ